MRMFFTMAREEVQKHIPYMAVWELRDSSVWNTGRRRRLWDANFSEKEKNTATRLFRLARKWATVSGVPDEVHMTVDTYKVWKKLESLHAML